MEWNTDQKIFSFGFFFLLIMFSLADANPSVPLNRFAVVLTVIMVIYIGSMPRHK